MSTPDTVALIDVSIVYGAARWLRGIHENPSNGWEGKYKAADDKQLFQEFLRDLLLYDKILITHNASPTELADILVQVETYAGTGLLDTQSLPSDDSQGPKWIADATCRLVKDKAGAPEKRQEMLSLPIPWAYTSGTHVDYKMVAQLVKEIDIDERLVPFIIFSYRGLCYSGFANNLAKTTKVPSAYVASPGRLAALEQIISAADLKRLEIARTAYDDLVSLLDLPAAGYDFSHLPSFNPYLFSQADLILNKLPREALKSVLKHRKSGDGEILRERWAQGIWAKTLSPAIGTDYPGQQKMENIAARNVTQIQNFIYATPSDPNATIQPGVMASIASKITQTMKKSKQEMKGVTARRRVRQFSDADDAEQKLQDVLAGGDVEQIAREKLGGADLKVLADQLATLRNAMREKVTAPEQDLAVGNIAAAEVVAREGSASKTIEKLKAAGRWALETAQTIGADVATAALKSALGL
jgi:hypothetical protein